MAQRQQYNAYSFTELVQNEYIVKDTIDSDRECWWYESDFYRMIFVRSQVTGGLQQVKFFHHHPQQVSMEDGIVGFNVEDNGPTSERWIPMDEQYFIVADLKFHFATR